MGGGMARVPAWAEMMITYTLERIVKNEHFTLGRLKTTIRSFWTMEDTVREVEGVAVEKWKIKGETAIPAGTYDLILTFSPRFQKMLPLLVDVPGYSGVRIHAGNGPKDTEGCILIGLGLNDSSNYILNSRAAMIDFMDEFEAALDANMPVQIEIK